MEKKFTIDQVNESRKQGISIYGFKKGYCDLIGCCDYCNKKIRSRCKMISKIEKSQEKIIKKICKNDYSKGE